LPVTLLHPYYLSEHALSKITIRLSGGLGNQLFQYAFGRSLSLRSKLPLALDTHSGFSGDSYHRSFALNSFHYAGELCPDHGFHTYRRIARQLIIATDRIRPKIFHRILRDPPPLHGSIVAGFDPELVGLRIGHNATVEGYWQSDRYFIDHADTIKTDLTMRYKPSRDDLIVADLINTAVCPIGLHVRRHRVPTGREDLQISLKYYREALKFMQDSNPNFQIFVFSDDHDWAIGNLDLGANMIHVRHNSDKCPIGDFWLLRQCRNFILSNSTFSWWAAWLGEHPAKVVVAPSSFYSRDDLVPIEWRRL
jgi:hypothetical protein